MLVQAKIKALGKREKSWLNPEGKNIISYIGNLSQNSGAVIDEIRLTQEQYQKWEPDHSYIVTGSLNKGHSGLYLQIVDIVPETAVKN